VQDSEVDISRGNYVASYIEGSIANGSGSNTEPLEMKSREVHGWSWFVGRGRGGSRPPFIRFRASGRPRRGVGTPRDCCGLFTLPLHEVTVVVHKRPAPETSIPPATWYGGNQPSENLHLTTASRRSQ